MNGFLVDANVLCEATRPKAEPRVLAWLAKHDKSLIVSVITLGEILKGIRLLARGARRAGLERWFQEVVLGFDGRVLPVDIDVMRVWADVCARNQRAGRLLSSFDSLLAATAVHHRLTLVTRNVQDFPTEVSIVDPWSARCH